MHRTPLLHSRRLDELVGTTVLIKAEHLQRGGAFKARGATNAVQRLPVAAAERGVAAHSSGNHAAALALAAAARGVPAHVVMPADAPAAKRAATEAYGAAVTTCEPTLAAREATLVEVLAATGATEVHPYDDPAIIAGAGTAALEVLEDAPDVGAIVVPVGGGGLASGTVLAVRGSGRDVAVHGAEPAGADDAARSLAGGGLVPSVDPDTICDGLRTSLSERTFAVLAGRAPATGGRGLDGITTVPDEEVVDAMRWLWTRTKQVVEPSGAIGVAAARALVAAGTIAPGTTVVVVATGGNVDLDRLPFAPGGPVP